MPLSKPRLHRVGLWLVVALGVLLIAIWAMGYGPAIARETIEVWIERAGALGPLLIIVLMMVSIVASPIPSAPVALVAGAADGHVALVAFIIARYIGRDHVERWLGDKAGFGLLGSQNLLMLTVFASRLLPFISFDAMSYAAGLSRLRLWRFLIATLAGILPASFLLAHFGAEAMSGDFGTAEWIIIGLGLMTAAPLLVAALWRTNRSTNAS